MCIKLWREKKTGGHAERELTSELRRDKDNLQEQLEPVTLPLPAPRVGFWAGPLAKKETVEQS